MSVVCPAIRPGSTARAASVRRPRSRRGTPVASHDRSWRSPPTPMPSSTRLPETCCREATCLATQTTGRNGRISTPYASRTRLVAAAATLSATVLSTNGTPVPATSWSTAHADSNPRSSTCRAARDTSGNASPRSAIVGRNTPIAGAAMLLPRYVGARLMQPIQPVTQTGTAGPSASGPAPARPR
jgi:hypothetical protein